MGGGQTDRRGPVMTNVFQGLAHGTVGLASLKPAGQASRGEAWQERHLELEFLRLREPPRVSERPPAGRTSPPHSRRPSLLKVN